MAVVSPTVRASSLRNCPRLAVYEATGAPARARSLTDERILYRGKSIGRDFTIMLAHTHGMLIRVDSGPDYWVPPELHSAQATDDLLVAELRIPWEFGIGHADVFNARTRTLVEVLSSAHASEAMRHSKLLQLVLYMEHYADAKDGALVVVSPSDLSEEVFPISRSSVAYGELVEEVRDRVAQLRAWSGSGQLPCRVCSKPSEARSHFCLYAEACFDGWEAPDVPVLADEAVYENVESLFATKTLEKEARARVSELETTRKALEARLSDSVPVGQYQSGGLVVTRTHVERKPTVDLRKAELAGFPVDALSEFMKPGASYDTWKVAPAETAEDFGDEAPF